MTDAMRDMTVSSFHVVADEAVPPMSLCPESGVMVAALDAALDAIMILELDGTVLFLNEGGRKALEVSDPAGLRGQPWDSLWAEPGRAEVFDAVAAARWGRATRFEGFCATLKGSPRWWDVSVAPIAGDAGRPERIVVVSRDVTERVHRENQLRLHEIELNELAREQADMLRDQRASLDASDALVREVDHRMKNSLAMLGSLLKMETRRVDDVAARATLKAAAARVATIASVHEQLYRGTEQDALVLSPYLEALVRDLSHSMDRGPDAAPVQVRVEADDLVMRGGKALALGLATVELVMNAITHGGDGAVEVECRRMDDEVTLSVSDRGPGLPSGFDPALSRGLGMRVVQSSLVKLQGTLDYANRAEGGARFTLIWSV